MRRRICACWIVLLSLALHAATQAQFNYTINDGTITITTHTFPYYLGGAVIIPSTINGLPVTRIGDAAFASCYITGVTIPDSVTSIGASAFYMCYYLQSVTIPTNLTSIGAEAFNYCNSLTNAAIPQTTTNIGSAAFYHCTSLGAITVDALNPCYCSLNGVLFDKAQTTLMEYPPGKTGEYAIPSSVTSIGEGAFAFCMGLTSVTISDSVTRIEMGTFLYCLHLSSVTIPNSVTSIGGSAFGECSELARVMLPNSITNIGDSAFSDTGLVAITIPSGVTSIGKSVFEGCNRLASVAIPTSVTDIGQGAFGYCTGLTSMAIPNSVTSLGDSAFEYCARLTNIVIPRSVTSIGRFAFGGCTSLNTVTVPSSVNSLGEAAFLGCTRLTGVYFQGIPPSLGGSYLFAPENVAIVYYLPGTTGWGRTYGGAPTVLWNPQVHTTDATFGVRSNRFGFTVTGMTNIPIVAEATTNLTSASWMPVQACTITNGSIYFSDPQWTHYATRFYRLRSP